jgi:hypothetical protein
MSSTTLPGAAITTVVPAERELLDRRELDGTTARKF